ncbi:MAG: serine hydrolase, partial [Proteobacteria bacterium]|nr:serine hydrolase [Pseudomonadota bacterium]
MSDAVDRLMQRYQGAVPGASVLVVRDGETLVCRSYGLADLEQGIATTPSTNYRLASMTKQFTAAAVLMLAEDGRIGLDDPVRRWLPSLHHAADAVSIRHLLTHTSGLVDYEDLIPASTTAQLRDADVLRLLAPQDRLYFPPGSGYRYSNSGYALLALIVERASGRAFSNFLRERIFLPAGMDGSLVQVPHGPTVQHRAYGYSELDAGWARTDQDRTSAVLGDGGVVVADGGNNRLLLFDEKLQFVKSIGHLGLGQYRFKEPVGVFVSPHDHIYVADWHNHRIVVYDWDLNYLDE